MLRQGASPPTPWIFSNENGALRFAAESPLPWRHLPSGGYAVEAGGGIGRLVVTNRLAAAVLAASAGEGTAWFDALSRAHAADSLRLDGFFGRSAGRFGVNAWIGRALRTSQTALLILDPALLHPEEERLVFPNQTSLEISAFDRWEDRLIWVTRVDVPPWFISSRLKAGQGLLTVSGSDWPQLAIRLQDFFTNVQGLSADRPFRTAEDLARRLQASPLRPEAGGAILRTWRWKPPFQNQTVQTVRQFSEVRTPGRETSLIRNFVHYRAKEPDRIEKSDLGLLFQTNLENVPGRFEEIP